MRPVDRSIILFTAVYVIAMIILILIGENRPDVYVSITILVYFIYISLDTSIRENTDLKLVNMLLLIIFFIIVAYRVLEILGIRVV